MIRAGEPQLQQKVYLAELRKAESFALMTNVSGENAPAREILRHPDHGLEDGRGKS